MATGAVMLAGGLPGDVGEKEMSLTVEEYLTAQCKERVGQLKRHVEGLVEGYMEQYKRARQTLSDAAAETLNNEAAADEAGSPVATAKQVRVCPLRDLRLAALPPPASVPRKPKALPACGALLPPPSPPHPPPISAR